MYMNVAYTSQFQSRYDGLSNNGMPTFSEVSISTLLVNATTYMSLVPGADSGAGHAPVISKHRRCRLGAVLCARVPDQLFRGHRHARAALLLYALTTAPVAPLRVSMSPRRSVSTSDRSVSPVRGQAQAGAEPTLRAAPVATTLPVPPRDQTSRR